MKTKNKTVKFVKETETKRTIKFEEAPLEGEPEIIGTLYVQKWFAGKAEVATLTLEVPDGTNE